MFRNQPTFHLTLNAPPTETRLADERVEAALRKWSAATSTELEAPQSSQAQPTSADEAHSEIPQSTCLEASTPQAVAVIERHTTMEGHPVPAAPVSEIHEMRIENSDPTEQSAAASSAAPAYGNASRSDNANDKSPAASNAQSQSPDPAADEEEDFQFSAFDRANDHYERLQISRNADMETVHRVYRFMAARFHPDNPETGDAERFLLLTQAYRVLSDAQRRTEYDAALLTETVNAMPVFQLKDFVDGVDGEVNRRLGVLSLLYHKRRINASRPGLSMLELEQRMSFPREYLTFTLWYLRSKRLVLVEDNSDYGISPEGIDYVEDHSSSNRVIRELLESGSGSTAEGAQTSAPPAAPIAMSPSERRRRRMRQSQSHSRKAWAGAAG